MKPNNQEKFNYQKNVLHVNVDQQAAQNKFTNVIQTIF